MKRIFSITLSLILTLTLSACQATPESEYVVQKDTERMIEQAVAYEQGTTSGELEIPGERYTYDFVDKKGKIHIHADANIVLPDADHFPIVRVSGAAFTEQNVKNLYSALCSNNIPVDSDASLPKAYYQTILDGLMQQRQSGNLDMQYETVEDLDKAIAEVMRDLDAAPQEPAATDLNCSFNELNGCVAQILSMPDDKTLSELFVMNNQESRKGVSAEYLRDVNYRAEFSAQTAQGKSISAIYGMLEKQSIRIVKPEMDENAALAIASQAIAQLGLPDFSCSGKRLVPIYGGLAGAQRTHECKGVYEFMFTRTVSGVAITYTNDTMSAEVPDKNAVNTNVSRPWLYEKIRIFVDDEGIFALIWNAPYTVEEVVNERATMLPFERIEQIFVDIMPLKYGQYGQQYDKSDIADDVEISVQKITLGLARVVEQGNAEQAVLVPVWDFFGSISGAEDYVLGSDGYDSLLTINAIDGSIVDRGLGY